MKKNTVRKDIFFEKYCATYFSKDLCIVEIFSSRFFVFLLSMNYGRNKNLCLQKKFFSKLNMIATVRGSFSKSAGSWPVLMFWRFVPMVPSSCWNCYFSLYPILQICRQACRHQHKLVNQSVTFVLDFHTIKD